MTWRDKLELGLKDDAAFRRDNLPADEVSGPEETSGPSRSPVVADARDKRQPEYRDDGVDPADDRDRSTPAQSSDVEAKDKDD